MYRHQGGISTQAHPKWGTKICVMAREMLTDLQHLVRSSPRADVNAGCRHVAVTLHKRRGWHSLGAGPHCSANRTGAFFSRRWLMASETMHVSSGTLRFCWHRQKSESSGSLDRAKCTYVLQCWVEGSRSEINPVCLRWTLYHLLISPQF